MYPHPGPRQTLGVTWIGAAVRPKRPGGRRSRFSVSMRTLQPSGAGPCRVECPGEPEGKIPYEPNRSFVFNKTTQTKANIHAAKARVPLAPASVTPAKPGTNVTRCPASYRGSSIFKNWSAATSFNTCCTPLGQRISTDAILVSPPNPKCTRLSLDDMKPTLMATWL